MPTECGAGPTAFVEAVTRFAGSAPPADLSQIISRMGHPVRVAVCGRAGVGRGTVEQALRRRGVHVVAEPAAELRLRVIAEVLKPEDRAALASSEMPTVIVLTKADVSASVADASTVSMIGLLATVTGLDDQLVAALRTFAEEPPDLSSVDAFIDTAHSVDRAVRTRLLDRLDRFGIANAVAALAAGAEPTAVVVLLQQLSNVDGVLARLHADAAAVRYRRVQHALAELRALAARTDDQRLWRFLAADATVAAVMAAALEVLEADEPDTDEPRAIHWSRYARGPVNALHRSCANDVVRGMLR